MARVISAPPLEILAGCGWICRHPIGGRSEDHKSRLIYRRLPEVGPVGWRDEVLAAKPRSSGRSEPAWPRRDAEDFSQRRRRPNGGGSARATAAACRNAGAGRPIAADKMPWLGHGRVATVPPRYRKNLRRE